MRFVRSDCKHAEVLKGSRAFLLFPVFVITNKPLAHSAKRNARAINFEEVMRFAICLGVAKYKVPVRLDGDLSGAHLMPLHVHVSAPAEFETVSPYRRLKRNKEIGDAKAVFEIGPASLFFRSLYPFDLYVAKPRIKFAERDNTRGTEAVHELFDKKLRRALRKRTLKKSVLPKQPAPSRKIGRGAAEEKVDVLWPNESVPKHLSHNFKVTRLHAKRGRIFAPLEHTPILVACVSRYADGTIRATWMHVRCHV